MGDSVSTVGERREIFRRFNTLGRRLKGPSHEIDFKNFDQKLKNLA
jgi:hypothetical protein